MRKIYSLFLLLLAIFTATSLHASVGLGAFKNSYSNGDEVIIFGLTAKQYQTGIGQSETLTDDCVFILESANVTIDGKNSFYLKQKSTSLYLNGDLSTLKLGMEISVGNATPFTFIKGTADNTAYYNIAESYGHDPELLSLIATANVDGGLVYILSGNAGASVYLGTGTNPRNAKYIYAPAQEVISLGQVKTSFAVGDEIVMYGVIYDEYYAGAKHSTTLSSDNVFELVASNVTVNGEEAFYLKQKSTAKYIKAVEGASASLMAIEMDLSVDNASAFSISVATSASCGNMSFITSKGFEEDKVTVAAMNNPSGSGVLYLAAGNSGGDIPYIGTTIYRNGLYTYGISESLRGALAVLLTGYNENSFVPGNVAGTYPTALVETFLAAYEEAYVVIGNEYAEETEITNAYNALKAAIDALEAVGVTRFENGFYRVFSAYPSFTTELNGEKVMTELNGTLVFRSYDKADLEQVWHITQLENGNYRVQNYSTGNIISHSMGESMAVFVLATPYAETVINAFSGDYEGDVQYSVQDTRAGLMYHIDSDEASGSIVGWNNVFNSGAAWYFRALSQEESDELDEISLQNKRNAAMRELIDLSFAKYNVAVTSTNGTTKLITSDGQLYTNAAHIGDGHGLPALIDEDEDTYFHSSYLNGPSEYHFLQVELAENTAQTFSMAFKRRMNNSANRPTNILISGSNDAADWTPVWAFTQGLPADDSTAEYVTTAFDMGQAYKYVRFTVRATNNGATHNGYPFFSFSEFQLYTSTVNANSQVAEMGDVAVEFLNAIRTALLVENATQADIDALQTALDEFSAIAIDPTALNKAIAEANALLSSTIKGNDPGQYPVSAANDLEMEIGIAQEEAENVEATYQSLAEALENLLNEIDAYSASINLTIEANKWYYIKGSSQALSQTEGKYMYAEGNRVKYGAIEDIDEDALLWRLIPVSATEYAIQNYASGSFIGKSGAAGALVAAASFAAGSYTVTHISSDSFEFKEEGRLPLNGPNAADNINTATGGVYTGAVWAFESAPNGDDLGETVSVFTSSYNVNQFYSICLPVALDGVGGATVYTIEGATINGNNEITEINLSEVDGGVVQAGQPFIMKVTESDVIMAWGTEGTTVAGSENGLVGVFTTSTLPSGIAYIADEKVQISEGSYVLQANSAYINEAFIPATSGSSDDSIQVNGTLTNIEGVIVDGNSLVNVYTTTGVQVRSKVKLSDATSNLSKGFYIVGKKKVVVK